MLWVGVQRSQVLEEFVMAALATVTSSTVAGTRLWDGVRTVTKKPFSDEPQTVVLQNYCVIRNVQFWGDHLSFIWNQRNTKG